MALTIKQEPMEESEPMEISVNSEIIDEQIAENKVFRCIEAMPDGVSVDHLSVLLPVLSQQQKQVAINSLLSSRKVVMIKDGQNTIKLKINNSTQLEDVSEEEQLVYSVIEDSKTKGTWIKELREETKLPAIQINKVLKSLENKKLIKTVKVVNSIAKKRYMLYALEPDISLTGGTFYSEQQLDSELIHTLVSVCTGFLQTRRKLAMDAHPNDAGAQKELSFARPQDVANYIAEKGLLTVEITSDDIQRILDVALLDGTVERRADGKVRATPVQHFVTPLTCMPCGICPLINSCKPGHVISPETCQYMSEWLQ